MNTIKELLKAYTIFGVPALMFHYNLYPDFGGNGGFDGIYEIFVFLICVQIVIAFIVRRK